MAGEEREALSLLAKQTRRQIAVADTHLAVVGYRTCDAECLQTLADGLGGVGCVGAALLDGDGRAYDVSPSFTPLIPYCASTSLMWSIRRS